MAAGKNLFALFLDKWDDDRCVFKNLHESNSEELVFFWYWCIATITVLFVFPTKYWIEWEERNAKL